MRKPKSTALNALRATLLLPFAFLGVILQILHRMVDLAVTVFFGILSFALNSVMHLIGGEVHRWARTHKEK